MKKIKITQAAAQPGELPGLRGEHRRRRIIAVAIIACGLVSGSVGIPARATDIEHSAWELVDSRYGVKVAQKDVANSPYKATRGTLISDARLFDALAVLRNVEACTDWLHKCRHGEVVTELSAGESIYYTVIDSPFVLKDRDIVMQSTTVYDAQRKTLYISMQGKEDFRPLHKKRVRVLGFAGSWFIEQHGSDQIKLTYEVHMNPQVKTIGAANSTLAKSVLETLVNVDRLASRAPYLDSPVSPARLKAITVVPSSE